jgi:hypothetical protein
MDWTCRATADFDPKRSCTSARTAWQVHHCFTVEHVLIADEAVSIEAAPSCGWSRVRSARHLTN